MKKLTLGVSYFLCFLAYSGGAYSAETVKIDLTFTKRPPIAGIFYAIEDTATAKEGVLDQKNKEFTSSIVVSDKKGKLTFKNTDDVDHNIFAKDPKIGVEFDVGLMTSGSTNSVGIDWQEDTLVRLGCKIHPRMRAYIANINSAAYVVFDFQKKIKEYSVSVENVNSSTTQFRFMFANFEDLTIDLSKGESKTVALLKRGKEAGSATISR